MDTIFAQASAQGRAGVSVIRISGSQAFRAVDCLCDKPVEPGRHRLRNLRDTDGLILDQALVLVFQAPASFTGENVVEFHVHGSQAVISAIFKVLFELENFRLAEAGEFTRRAMENGKFDLIQVEGIADLIDAETEAQRKQAMRALSGTVGERAEIWRRDLIRAASLLEVTIDFADEEVPVDVTPEVSSLLETVRSQIDSEVRGYHAAERVRSGFEVAIVGPPNSGKSTLLNALSGRSASITSEIAGTTRDVIEVRMDLGGIPVTFLDTAGLRESMDTVEKIGISVARDRARQADLRVFLAEDPDVLGVDVGKDDVVLRPKADLRVDRNGSISGLTGYGIDVLIKRLTDIFSDKVQDAGLATRERHKIALSHALGHFDAALTSLSLGADGYDLVAEDIRFGIRELEHLTGRIDVENVLDEIFSSFCLGK